MNTGLKELAGIDLLGDNYAEMFLLKKTRNFTAVQIAKV